MLGTSHSSRVAIICDLSPTSGLGHIKRVSLLADALKKKGSECFFIFDKNDQIFVSKEVLNSEIYWISFGAEISANDIASTIMTTDPDIVVIDSYFSGHFLEAHLREKGAFVVSIDDHMRRHDGHLVFNNQSGPIINFLDNPKMACWHIGPEYILAPNISRRAHFSGEHVPPSKILLHAGGSSAYASIIPLVRETLRAADRHKFTIDIICTEDDAKGLINELIIDLGICSTIKFTPYIEDLAEQLFQYDIVAGPAGTTTFEAIQAGVLPLSVPLTDDGRDSPHSWPYLGHLLHLSYNEAQQQSILESTWDLAVERNADLIQVLEKHACYFDGNGAARIAVKILSHFESHNKKLEVVIPVDTKIIGQNMSFSQPCLISDARLFLESRNQDFVRENSSNSEHIIVWPEHLNWWLLKGINRFSLWSDGKIVAFHWSKVVHDEIGRFVISGWMPTPGQANKFKIAALALKHQVEHVRDQFAGELWLISMNIENEVTIFLNKRFGFTPAGPEIADRAKKKFGVFSEKFIFMEMKL